jgi:hypothetical protein
VRRLDTSCSNRNGVCPWLWVVLSVHNTLIASVLDGICFLGKEAATSHGLENTHRTISFLGTKDVVFLVFIGGQDMSTFYSLLVGLVLGCEQALLMYGERHTVLVYGWVQVLFERDGMHL